MGTGDHRLAAGAAMGRAESAAGTRAEHFAPTAGSPSGDDPGVPLASASAEALAAMGMSPDADIPDHGPLQQERRQP